MPHEERPSQSSSRRWNMLRTNHRYRCCNMLQNRSTIVPCLCRVQRQAALSMGSAVKEKDGLRVPATAVR
eukprot:42190-Eustigmatos_ZCMA.PRE.1